MLSNHETLKEPIKKHILSNFLNCDFKTKDYDFLHLHEQKYLMSKNVIAKRKERLLASFHY